MGNVDTDPPPHRDRTMAEVHRAMATSAPAILTLAGFDRLFAVLRDRGYRLIGPTLRDQAIVYGDVASPADLPRGWSDEQDGGRYRLVRRQDDALFGYAVGPDSWKRLLHPPMQNLWTADRTATGVTVTPEPPSSERFAFIGVRACELHAIAIQDRVLMEGGHPDPAYRARRQNAFLVAVNCGTPGGACFCTSMQTGPRADSGFDLVLTELLAAGEHRFLIAAGSADGEAVLAQLPRFEATPRDRAAADDVVARCAAGITRHMPAAEVHALLLRTLAHPRWNDVARRCLTCGNCTMVCPTCFCTTVEDASDLSGQRVSRSQRWDSCFTLDFSYLHGGSVRASPRSRYRQWMTHKLATWWDQFGTSGCVGCGRCITWCPVGIDITEEVAAIQASDSH